MNMFNATLKRWGNSVGFIVPNEIIKEYMLTPEKKVRVVLLPPKMDRARKVFGKLNLKRPTQKVMDEIDEGYD